MYHPTVRRRAFTLLEAIVVMGIMVVILGAAHTFLASGVGFYINSVQGLEVQQQALVGMTRMADELENSNRDAILLEQGVTVLPPDPLNLAPVPQISTAITFPNIFSITGDYTTTELGKPVWQSTVCYYPVASPDGGFLVERRVDPIAPGVDYPPNPLDAGRDYAFFAGVGATGVIARNVQSLVAVPGTDSIDLYLRVTFSQRSTDNLRIESRVFPKN
jgi:type II secretory pathway pseudopilin PulG